ncbi:MAG: VPLPA-CTERM sorting domain-containing protein, partial [Planctomycetota bacterium]
MTDANTPGSLVNPLDADRLKRYSAIVAAMGATGVVAVDAAGQVAYSGANRNIVVVQEAAGLFFDVDEDANVTGYEYGAGDLFLKNYILNPGGNYLSVEKALGDSGSLVGFTATTPPVVGFGYVSALSNGFVIDGTSTITDQVGGGTSNSVFGNIGLSSAPTIGDATFFNYPATPTYIGFEFTSDVLGGSQHFGWLQVLVSVPAGQFTIIDWAFETQPGVAVLAGDTGSGLLIEQLGPQPGIPGDANDDGVVDLLDFDVLAQNFGSNTGNGAADGDFNDDGVVDLLDFDVLAQNFGATSPAAVPEPASLGLLGLGAAGLTAMRRRRKLGRACARR